MIEEDLKTLAAEVRRVIKKRIESKTDLKGESFEPYSFSYWAKFKFKGKKTRAKRNSKAWQRWMIARKAVYDSEKYDVSLVQTGAMLNSLQAVEINPKLGFFQMGFTDEEAANVAYYHNIEGAGAGRKLRTFFGLTEKEISDLEVFAGPLVLKDSKQLTALVLAAALKKGL